MPGPTWKTYKDFIVRIQRAESEGLYRADAQGPSGEGETTFRLPFSESDLKLFLLQVGRPRRSGVRSGIPEQVEPAVQFGLQMYNAVFSGTVRDVYISARHSAELNGYGLRIQLRLADAPELSNLPWEFLYDGRDFLALSDASPIVRYHDLANPPRAMQVELPLRILVTISAPLDLSPLDVKAEEANVREGIKRLADRGLVEVTFTQDATLGTLQRTLRTARASGKPYHVWHYIGHGAWDPAAKESVLIMCNDSGVSYLARGFQLGTLFNGYPEVRLALLNACEGARVGTDDPFAGVAAALVERGISAVIGMQFEITDRAAITFAGEFYSAVVDGLPIDSAITEARRAVFFEPNWFEWATPVLFMRVGDGRLFSVRPPSSVGKLPTMPVKKDEPAKPAAVGPVRPPGTTFLGRALDQVSSLIMGKNGLPKVEEAADIKKPAAIDPIRMTPMKPPPITAVSDRIAQVDAAPSRYFPLPHGPGGPHDRFLLPQPWRIWFEVRSDNQTTQLGIDLYGETAIGRNQFMTSQPMLDLEPFDGKAMGVSRLHMLVRPMKDGIYAVDQGSTNGTFINGIKLEPGNVIKLRDNDIIALSRLVLILHIVSVPDIEAPASPAATVM